MRARHFLALFAAGFTAIAAVGCDGGDGSGAGGGNGGAGGTGGEGGSTPTTSGDTTSSTENTGGGTTSSSTTTTTTTSNTGDENKDFASAEDITVFDGQIQELLYTDLDPIATDQDYFKFEGSKGDQLLLLTVAKTGSGDGFADGYPDTVITLYNSAMQQIAQNDDPIPRNTQDASLYTVLPADGTYYVKLEDFCQVLGAGAEYCNDEYFDAITEVSVGLGIAKLDSAADGNVSEPATDNDMPVAIGDNEYEENAEGTGYYAMSIVGTFKSATDIDSYTLTPPTAISPPAGTRETVFFEVYPTGPDGNGSTVPTGKVWLEDADGNKLAQVDGTQIDPIDGYPIEAPVPFGQQYTLHVESSGTPGANPFYYILHYRSGAGPFEVGDIDATTNNNTLADAEPLEISKSTGGYDGGYVAGNLVTALDVADYYLMDAVPKAGDVAFGTCYGLRIGSGLQGLKMSLINAANGQTIGSSSAETITGPASFGDNGLDLGGATSIAIKVEAAGQDAEVLGNYYKCFVVFLPPTP